MHAQIWWNVWAYSMCTVEHVAKWEHEWELDCNNFFFANHKPTGCVFWNVFLFHFCLQYCCHLHILQMDSPISCTKQWQTNRRRSLLGTSFICQPLHYKVCLLRCVFMSSWDNFFLSFAMSHPYFGKGLTSGLFPWNLKYFNANWAPIIKQQLGPIGSYSGFFAL